MSVESSVLKEGLEALAKRGVQVGGKVVAEDAEALTDDENNRNY